jgi:hypothetical protein
MLAADVGLESPTYVKVTGQNATIEPALATLSGGGEVVETRSARVQERRLRMGGRGWRGAKLILTGLAGTDDAASFCCALSAEIRVARALIRAAERRQSPV